MAFESLSQKLQETFKKLRGKGKISEADLKEAMREIKLALLDADVNFKVVKNFVASISEKAVGQKVMESLTPGQMIIKIVSDELTLLLGGSCSKINFSPKPPTVIMMAGLQGAGKTTTVGKLAKFLKSQGKRPLLAACDVYRPAAVDQLVTVAAALDIPVFFDKECSDPVKIAAGALEKAEGDMFDVLIIDTAGRLHIDRELMDELSLIKKSVGVHETLLVVDAMTGQDAAAVAEAFDRDLSIDGVILTKLDGDARGGAALSVTATLSKPIKYVGMGEKSSDIEQFYPDRMASRILGMGDVLTLIEKAEQALQDKTAAELQNKFLKSKFDLDDFLEQMSQIRKIGSIPDILGMLPGVNAKKFSNADLDEKKLNQTAAIIQSMTKAERQNPSIINSSRKQRIAKGSGVSVQAVNALLKQFSQMQAMFKQFSGHKFGHTKKSKFSKFLPF